MMINKEDVKLKNELEEVLKNNKVDITAVEEIEDMVAPSCGCCCDGMGCR